MKKEPKAPRQKVSYDYRKYKGDTCSKCGFVPEHPCQLDVDHIDEDHANNDPSNLQTLCSNCHRLKTQQYRINVRYKKTPASN